MRTAGLPLLTSVALALRVPPAPFASRAPAVEARAVVRLQDQSTRGNNDEFVAGPESLQNLTAAALTASAQSLAASLNDGNAASVQFMMTQRMRATLAELGYPAAEIDGMEPSRAAAIIAAGTRSSRVPQKKPKTKRDRFELRFTCNVCDAPNSHSISRHAYTKGTVIVTCPGCNSTHLIADNLEWIDDDFGNLEREMAKRGTPIRRIVNDGIAAAAAEAAWDTVKAEGDDPLEDEALSGSSASAAVTKAVPDKIDGISDDQALRIREAMRARRRKKFQGEDESGTPG